MSDAEFPGFAAFSVLAGFARLRQFHARIELSVGEGFAAVRGELRIETPVNVRWMMGQARPKDFIFTSIVAPKIISDRVVAVLEAQQATGWRTYSVVLRGRDDELIPGYHGLSVTGRCGPLQKDRAKWIKKRFPAGIFPHRQGYFFEESSWDGSDLFVPSDGTGVVFVTQRIADALAQAQVSGVVFVRADLMEFQPWPERSGPAGGET